jgi:hypothetical protein
VEIYDLLASPRTSSRSGKQIPQSLIPLPARRGAGKILTHTPTASRMPAIRGDGLMNVPPDAQDVGSKSSSEYRARQRDRERRRRREPEQSITRQAPSLERTPPVNSSSGAARRAAATTCGWCHGAITLRSRGPIPKWCSATCRHRAWEQSRAAASGRSAVQIVEQVVTVPAKPPATAPAPRQLGWVHLLRELAAQLEQGMVYDRHLPAIAAALEEAARAAHRRGRPTWTGTAPRP